MLGFLQISNLNLVTRSKRLADELLSHRFVDFVAQWENPLRWPTELDLLNYKVEQLTDTDPLRKAAQAAANSPDLNPRFDISLALWRPLRVTWALILRSRILKGGKMEMKYITQIQRPDRVAFLAGATGGPRRANTRRRF